MNNEIDDLTALVIEQKCTRLSYQYCNLIDDGEYTAFEALWTSTAVFEHPAETYTGIEGLRKFLAGRPVNKFMRHFCTNVCIDVVSDVAATGTVAFIVLQSVKKPDNPADAARPTPIMFGRYHDEYVKQDGVWKFQRRKLTALRH
jgi:hypothetical protein